MSDYSVGWRIKKLRAKLNISQEQLALRAEITPVYLGQIERGERNPTVKVVERLSEHLGLSLPDFFSITNAPSDVDSASTFGDRYIQQISFEIADLTDLQKAQLVEIIKDIVKFKKII